MIEVEFPDGTVREVPSITREIKSREIGGSGASTFVEEPAFDNEWRFSPALGNKWRATLRR